MSVNDYYQEKYFEGFFGKCHPEQSYSFSVHDKNNSFLFYQNKNIQRLHDKS